MLLPLTWRLGSPWLCGCRCFGHFEHFAVHLPYALRFGLRCDLPLVSFCRVLFLLCSVVLCSRRQDIFSKCRVRSWLCARELVPALDFRSCFALGLDLRTGGFGGASPFRFTVSVRERAVNEAAPCVSLVWLRVCFVWLCFRGAAPRFPGCLPCRCPRSLFPYARMAGFRSPLRGGPMPRPP